MVKIKKAEKITAPDGTLQIKVEAVLEGEKESRFFAYPADTSEKEIIKDLEKAEAALIRDRELAAQSAKTEKENEKADKIISKLNAYGK